MLLLTIYTVHPSSARFQLLDLPLDVDITDTTRASLVDHDGSLRLLMKHQVDTGDLEVVPESGWHRSLPDGTHEPIPGIKLRNDHTTTHVLVRDLLAALSFLTDEPLSLAHAVHDDKYLPENAEDRRLLERLGTDIPCMETTGRAAIRTFSAPVTPENIVALMRRRIGLRIYADALKAGFEVAKFRELWRVLESAFGAQNNDLVSKLSTYPPAKQLGFNEQELNRLLVLRGRASHAQSKAGLRELADVESACAEKLPRLSNLVERVILTKASWGYPTIGVEELAPVRSYVAEDGTIVLIKK